MKLSEQHEKFAQLVANGSNQSDAFREIRPHVSRWKDKSVHEAASKLYAKVLPRIIEIQKELAKKNLWSREKSVIALKGIVERKVVVDDVETGAQDKDVISAVKELNSMHGFNEPTKTQQIGSDGNPIDNNISISISVDSDFKPFVLNEDQMPEHAQS